ncbi:hypothetical protein B2J93_3578 [Marssonina coronariae]|uniref:Uncharacterized protein n=1 Tax=Diplocarpon coronariae TaxID=2795749 RepID=A0A218Z4K8_9HELO|nr:hypothetical protein B2J93_3578 [Marssonina coronariae]
MQGNGRGPNLNLPRLTGVPYRAGTMTTLLHNDIESSAGQSGRLEEAPSHDPEKRQSTCIPIWKENLQCGAGLMSTKRLPVVALNEPRRGTRRKYPTPSPITGTSGIWVE